MRNRMYTLLGIECIDPDKNNRLGEEPTLIPSIKTEGIINPITVRKAGDRYEIVSGNRRYASAKAYGITQIPCLVIDDEQVAAIQGAENLDRKPLRLTDQARVIEGMLHEGKSPEECMSIANISKSTYHKVMRMMSLAPEIKTELGNGKLSQEMALALAALEHEDQLKIFKGLSDMQKVYTSKEMIDSSILGGMTFLPEKEIQDITPSCAECPYCTHGENHDLFEGMPEYLTAKCGNVSCLKAKVRRYAEEKGVPFVAKKDPFNYDPKAEKTYPEWNKPDDARQGYNQYGEKVFVAAKGPKKGESADYSKACHAKRGAHRDALKEKLTAIAKYLFAYYRGVYSAYGPDTRVALDAIEDSFFYDFDHGKGIYQFRNLANLFVGNGVVSISRESKYALIMFLPFDNFLSVTDQNGYPDGVSVWYPAPIKAKQPIMDKIHIADNLIDDWKKEIAEDTADQIAAHNPFYTKNKKGKKS